MSLKRRNFLRYLTVAVTAPLTGISSLLKPVAAWADWNSKAFWAGKQEDALENLFPGKSIAASDEVAISMHEFIENGAVVPIKIKTTLPDVSSISILVEKNPNPLIAHFELNPRCLGQVSTRIKVDKPSNITALVQSKGELFSKTQFVEVAEGGCG